VIGLAMMFALGSTWVVGRGDNRVAAYLAQQKIEALRSVQYTCMPLRDDPGTPGQQFTPVAPCPVAQRVPQVYHEVNLTPSSGAGQHAFTRLTTVECFAADLTGALLPPCDTGVKRISVQVIPTTMRETEDVTIRAFCVRSSGLVVQDVC
jgi:hypothetical protein